MISSSPAPANPPYFPNIQIPTLSFFLSFEYKHGSKNNDNSKDKIKTNNPE